MGKPQGTPVPRWFVIRIHVSVIPDKKPIWDFIQARSTRWFWALHDTKTDPHYHFFMETDLSDNNIRQHIRKFLIQGSGKSIKSAYGVGLFRRSINDTPDEALIKYMSYCCFKESEKVTEYNYYNFEDQIVQKARERQEELQEPVAAAKNKQKADILAAIMEHIGPYRHWETHYENVVRFAQGRHKLFNHNLYVQGKQEAYLRLWRDVSLKRCGEYFPSRDEIEWMEYNALTEQDAKRSLEKRIDEQILGEAKRLAYATDFQ